MSIRTINNNTNGSPNHKHTQDSSDTNTNTPHRIHDHNLTNAQISRYSRQLILSQFGVIGQQCIQSCKLLIIGAGGLGSPVALYCAAAGFIHITIVDHDTVDISNLHRQIIHDQSNSMILNKSISAKLSIERLNNECIVTAIIEQFTTSNASELISLHDIIVDCTDNVATRYLINDVSILHNKPIVSGAALKLDGQCTIYGYHDTYTNRRGPCYRCIFPIIPSISTVQNCSDGGVLGSVVGVIGTIQANEVIKLACLLKYNELINTYYKANKLSMPDPFTFTVLSGKLLLFDGLNTDFKKIKLRSRNLNCIVCGDQASITLDTIQSIEYAGTLGIQHDQPAVISCKLGERNPIADQLIMSKKKLINSVTVQQYKQLCDMNELHILIDVREPVQYDICHLPHSINIPLRQLNRRASELLQLVDNDKKKKNVYTICRRGIDSVHAVDQLKQNTELMQYIDIVANIDGGLLSWHQTVDQTFPLY